jgi:hypothetical protein
MKNNFYLPLFIIFCIFFFVSRDTLNAQNKRVVILGGVGYAFEPKVYNLSKAPEKLPDVSTYNTSWENILQCGLNSFSLEHLNYYGEVTAAYSIFGLGNYLPFWESLRDKFIKEVADVIFSNSALLEIIYEWVRPYYSDAFDALGYTFQIQYIDLLRNAKLYMDGFDYKKELADLNKNEKEFANQKGKLNAFLFRRIHNKQMTIEECRYWIDKIINDFEGHLKNVNDPRSYCDEITELKGGCNLCRGYFKTGGKYYDLMYKLYDKKFHTCIFPEFDNIYEFDNGYLLLKKSDKEALVSGDGVQLTEFKYNDVFSFNNYGLAAVCMEKIFKDTVIADQDIETYYTFPPFDPRTIKKGDTIFDEHKNILWGFIDKTGREVFPLENSVRADTITLVDPVSNEVYDQMYLQKDDVDFLNGVEVLNEGEYFGLADFSGQIIIPFQYKSMIEVFADDKNLPQLLIVNEGGKYIVDEVNGSYIDGGKWALMDIKGKNITGFIYDKLDYSSDDQGIALLHFKRDKISGTLDRNGKEHK